MAHAGLLSFKASERDEEILCKRGRDLQCNRTPLNVYFTCHM